MCFKHVRETGCFCTAPWNGTTYEGAQEAVVCFTLYLCVSFWAPPSWITSVSYLMDGWRLRRMFCLQAGDGFDWPSRQHSGSVALSVCIGSRKLTRWKRLIIGLKSRVMIVYWTRFPPWPALSSFFLSFFPLCSVWSILLPSLPLPPVTKLFNEIHLSL